MKTPLANHFRIIYNAKRMNTLKTLNRYAQGYRRFFLLAIISACLVQAAATLEPLIIKMLIDNIFSGLPFESSLVASLTEKLGGTEFLKTHIMIVAALYLGLVALKSFFEYGYTYFAEYAAQGIAKDLRISIYDTVQRLPFKAQNNFQTGDLIQRCTSDIETVSVFFANQLISAVSTIVLITFIVLSMISLSPVLSLISGIFLSTIIVSSVLFFIRFEKAYTKAEETESKFFVTVQEYVTNIRVVKAFNGQKLEAEKFEKSQNEFLKHDYKTTKMFGTFWTVIDFISYTNLAIIVISGSYLLLQNKITAGTIIAFISYVYKIDYPVRNLSRVISRMSKIKVSVKRLQEVLTSETELLIECKKSESAYSNSAAKTNRQYLPPEQKLKGTIEFTNVCLRYENSNANVLEDISFKIESGKTLAIMGATGSGKTSLVQLLPRLYEYTGGSIKIDGVELNTMDKSFVRKNIGLILQEPFLFSKTIRENVKIANAHFTDEQMYKACKTACIYQDIINFEKGFDTLVGEKGVLLSGGQRQRIAIARTIINRYPILIFDDSLSAVDTETDFSIRAALENSKEKATRIIISHRIATCKNADIIIYLENGKIVQSGTHDELIQAAGHYKKIYELQMELDEKKSTCRM